LQVLQKGAGEIHRRCGTDGGVLYIKNVYNVHARQIVFGR
jgi:hypothetical protein